MKRLLIAAGAALMLAACNNQESGGSSTREMSAMDSLRKEIDDIHIVAKSESRFYLSIIDIEVKLNS